MDDFVFKLIMKIIITGLDTMTSDYGIIRRKALLTY